MKNREQLNIFAIAVITLGGVFCFSIIQNKIVSVSAQIDPIEFMEPNADFGIVFPSEALEKEFYISVSDGYEYPISYSLILQPKPRADFSEEVGEDVASEYCILNPEDIENCYPLLCPYLDLFSKENEDDNKNYATLKEIPGDNTDYWKVVLNVPLIKGFAGQDFNGIPVDNADEYGCDISLVLLETVGPQFVPGSTVFTTNTGIYYPLIGPRIFDEKIEEVGEDYVVLTWLTDFPATSRVIYDIISHPILGFPPNYSYTFTTLEQDLSPRTQFHKIRINDLIPGTTYFYRTVSRGSPEMASREHSFTTKEVSEEATSEIAIEPSQSGGEEGENLSSQAAVFQVSIEAATSLPTTETKEAKRITTSSIQQDTKTAEVKSEEEIREIGEGTSRTEDETGESALRNKSQNNLKNLLAAIGNLSFSWKLLLLIFSLILLGLVVLWLYSKITQRRQRVDE